MFCGRLRLYQRMGRILLRVERAVRAASFPVDVHHQLAVQREIRLELQGSFFAESGQKCKLPMFFIHGDADTYVPTWMVYPLYEAKSEPKELWLPPVPHTACPTRITGEYTERVKICRKIHLLM